MSLQSVLLPVFVQLLLTLALLGLLVKTRRDALTSGVRPAAVQLSDDAYPPLARQAGNSYANQFEIPMLFFLAVIFGWVLHQAGWLFVLIEWLFVLSRVGHALVHVTSNHLLFRGSLFVGSVIAVALLWLLIFVGTFFGTVIY